MCVFHKCYFSNKSSKYQRLSKMVGLNAARYHGLQSYGCVVAVFVRRRLAEIFRISNIDLYLVFIKTRAT